MELTIDQMLQRGVSAHRDGKYEEAYKFYRAILKAQRGHPDANHNMGILAIQADDYPQAIAFFQNAIHGGAQVKQYWISYVSALIKIGRTNKANSVLRKAQSSGIWCGTFEKLSNDIKNIDEKHKLLIDLLKKNKISEAFDFATRLCRAHKENANFASVLGVINFKLENYHKALEQYELAVKLDAFAVDAYVNRALCQKQLRKPHHALRSLLKAIITQPDFLLGYQQFGNLLLEMGKTERSVSIHLKAVCLSENEASSFVFLGTSLLGAGEYKLAAINFAKAIKLQSDNAATHAKLAQLRQNAGDILLSIKSFKKAVLLQPDDDNYLDLLGIVLIGNTQYDEATIVFEWSRSAHSEFRLLECLYKENKFELIEHKIADLAQKRSNINLDVAAFSAFFSKVVGRKDRYPFCANPLNYLHFEHLSQYVTDFERFIDQLGVEIETEVQSWQPFDRPVHVGHQTVNNLFHSSSPKIKFLANVIHQSVEKFFQKYQSDTNWLVTRRPQNFHLEGWSVNLFKGGYQDNHSHPTGWVSGILYLKVVSKPVENEGSIEFNLNCLPGLEYALKEPKFLYQPKVGDIILFPSSLFHRTTPVMSDVNRRIVSFDLKPER